MTTTTTKVVVGQDEDEYGALVREGRRLRAAEIEFLTNDQQHRKLKERFTAGMNLRYGVLAQRAAPKGKTKANNGNMEKLKTYAKDIGVSVARLRECRDVSTAWLHAAAAACEGEDPPVAWKVFVEGAKVRGHEAILEKLLAEGKQVQFRDWAKIQGKPPSDRKAVSKTPAQEKAAEVKAHLRDEEVRAIIRKSRSTSEEMLEAKKTAEVFEREAKQAMKEADKAAQYKERRHPIAYWADMRARLEGSAMFLAIMEKELDGLDVVPDEYRRLFLRHLRDVQKTAPRIEALLDPAEPEKQTMEGVIDAAAQEVRPRLMLHQG